jgi:hypothetical protein
MDGVADIEYASTRAHGWVESKTCRTPRNNGPYVLGTVFTPQQASWLLKHDRPSIHLRSYLLIGAYQRGRFDHFLIITPRPAAALFVEGRERIAGHIVRTREGVTVLRSAELVSRFIMQGGKVHE